MHDRAIKVMCSGFEPGTPNVPTRGSNPAVYEHHVPATDQKVLAALAKPLAEDEVPTERRSLRNFWARVETAVQGIHPQM